MLSRLIYNVEQIGSTTTDSLVMLVRSHGGTALDIDDGHGRFRRNPGDFAPEKFIEHDVADDENPAALESAEDFRESLKSNADVARLTYLSPNTVKSYIRNIYRKIDVSSRTQAVLWGVQHGFTPDHRRIEHWRGGP